MMKKRICCLLALIGSLTVAAQIGTRFPSERKVINDPKTGVELVFLTSKSGTGDSKIYQTHNQWTSDGRWVIFRSDRVKGEAMAVNEETGDIVQVTEGGYTGMLCVARKSMNLYIMRVARDKKGKRTGMEVVEINLEKLFADSEAGKLKKKQAYERICGVIPAEMCSEGDMAGDDFARELWLIDRHTGERILLTAGHKTTARDHVHPTFKPDGTAIEIQSAMLSSDGRSMNICIVRLPQRLVDRYKK